MKKIYGALCEWPNATLSPNNSNWKGKQEAKNDEKEIGFYEAKLAIADQKKWIPPKGRIKMQITFWKKDKRLHDLDNLLSSMKYRIDGMCKALEIDDSQLRPIVLDLKLWKENYDAVQIDLYQ